VSTDRSSDQKNMLCLHRQATDAADLSCAPGVCDTRVVYYSRMEHNGKHLDHGRELGGKEMRLMGHSTDLSLVIRTRSMFSSWFRNGWCKLSNQ
jgi:hypothetical protein